MCRVKAEIESKYEKFRKKQLQDEKEKRKKN